MGRILRSCVVTALLAAGADAATLSVSADQAGYLPSDTITLTLTGDAEGAFGLNVFAKLLFTGTGGVEFVSATQQTQTGFGGGISWTPTIVPLTGDSTMAIALSQVTGPAPLPADGPFLSTIVLHAVATGVVNVSFETTPGQLSFYGLSDGQGTSLLITPEPTTAALVCFGLLGLSLARHR